MKPSSYKQQKACENCKHCIRTLLINNCCNRDHSYIEIDYSAIDMRKSEHKRMSKWVDEHRVEASGTCDKHEGKE